MLSKLNKNDDGSLTLTEDDIKKLENAESQALDGAPLHRVQGGPH
jgi:hypothetical protein